MASQFLRRASSGWVDCRSDGVEEEVVVALRERLVRRVSCRPGAEGAPVDVLDLVLEVEVAWEEEGTMRRLLD